MSSDMIRPEKVYFEVTNHCNFNCDFCPMQESRRPRQHMDFALFKKGIDDIVADDITDCVGFHVLGEPLLHPQVGEAICYAGSQGLRTSLNTNGSLLTQDAVRGLIDAGLDQLSISVQILGEENHRCRGTALPFETYYRRVMDALRTIREAGSPMEVVLCYMNTSTGRLFDIDKPIRASWRKDLGRARLLFFILDAYTAIGERVSREEVALAVERLDLLQPKFVNLDDRLSVYVQPMMDWGNAFTRRRIYPVGSGFCGYCLSNLGVLSNGEVTICCGDYDGATSLGNLATQSLAEILSSERTRAIADAMGKMRLIEPYCRRCFGSPNPLKAAFKGLGSIYLFKVLKFQPTAVRQVPLLAGRAQTHARPHETALQRLAERWHGRETIEAGVA